MNSTNTQIPKDPKIDVSMDLTDMSPVTNLAFNLSGLSTSSIAGTPIRRISWSNPIPGGSKISLDVDDMSPSTLYSPSFDEGIISKPKARKVTRRVLSQRNVESRKQQGTVTDLGFVEESYDQKENLSPEVCAEHENLDVLKPGSQDSGYLSMSQPLGSNSQSSQTSSPFIKRKSSIYVDEDSMENIFAQEETDEIQDFLSIPDNMTNLFTKPLVNVDKATKLTPAARKDKQPIRRCLSMEINFNPASSVYPSAQPVLSPTKELVERSTFKRPEPPNDYFTLHNKRRKSSPSIVLASEETSFVLKRSYSETAATIMQAVAQSDLQPDLIGDGSRAYALPLVKGRHHDLKSISTDTLVSLMRGEYRENVESFILIDCRYPYEYDGGHIKGAQNIYTKEDILETFLEKTTNSSKQEILIFHCEFSSERAPNLCRFLRNKDREKNEESYPCLNCPEIYLLEGGYKAFYEKHKEFCQPQSYKPMNHKDHGFEFRHFRAKSKSWGTDSKARSKMRSYSSASIV